MYANASNYQLGRVKQKANPSILYKKINTKSLVKNINDKQELLSTIETHENVPNIIH